MGWAETHLQLQAALQASGGRDPLQGPDSGAHCWFDSSTQTRGISGIRSEGTDREGREMGPEPSLSRQAWPLVGLIWLRRVSPADGASAAGGSGALVVSREKHSRGPTRRMHLVVRFIWVKIEIYIGGLCLSCHGNQGQKKDQCPACAILTSTARVLTPCPQPGTGGCWCCCPGLTTSGCLCLLAG